MSIALLYARLKIVNSGDNAVDGIEGQEHAHSA